MPNISEQKYFAGNDGRLNSDDDVFAVAKNEWVNMENCRTKTTDAGVTGVVESVGSTELISTPQPSVTFINIGSVEDDENNRLIEFKFCQTAPFHKIVCYDNNAEVEYDVLLSSQVTGGLNFDKNSIIHSARIANGMLYWVDGTNNQPRKININSAIKANYPSYSTSAVPYEFPLNFSEITLIKPPPPLSPSIVKVYDNTFINNFIANESFQFAYQFIYYDNEITVTGFYSIASKLNSMEDTYNTIRVAMNPLQNIPSTVRFVNLIARLGNTNNAYVVKSWDKKVSTDLVEIENQNNGTSLLSYNFLNDTIGNFISEDDVLRPFDKVPIYSETLELAKSRLFLGNNTEGYDTPLTTSLQVSLGSTVNPYQRWVVSPIYKLELSNDTYSGHGYGYSAWLVYIDWAIPSGYYQINSTAQTNLLSPTVPTLPAIPTTVNYETGLSYLGNNITDIIYSITASWEYPNLPIVFQNNGTTIEVQGVQNIVFGVFPQRSTYKGGIVFYDFAMRKSGVVTNDNSVITTGDRNYTFDEVLVNLDWQLSNSNRLTEIPDWAYYYAPVITKNQRTDFFIQSLSRLKYATKDANGQYIFTSTIYGDTVEGIGIETKELVKSGLGYVYQEGDLCILIEKTTDTIYNLPIIGQSGNFIIVKADDLGTLNSSYWAYEIYTPYKPSQQEPFFEVGQLYKINNPSTIDKSYSTLSGLFTSDTFVLSRYLSAGGGYYMSNAMCPNDLFYKRWNTDAGKPNFVTKLGQVQKKQYISWSDTFIPNTAINGLSTFRVLNEKAVPEDCGEIQKLILTSKVQNEGTVMLSICTVETNSMYLGETQITDSTGATKFFSSSTDVISTINTLKGSFGTLNPESVTAYRGNVFWLDLINGRYVQYSANGLFPISNYKMQRFWKLFSKQFLSMTTEQIEALGSRPFVFSTVDSIHDELLVSIPKLLAVPPKGYLPDYPSTIYPFDIYDGQGKTIVYKLDLGGIGVNPHWQGAYSFNPEGFCVMRNELYSFYAGLLYKHNSLTSQNNFYGIQYKSKIMIVSNEGAASVKSYNNISVQSNLVPTFVYLYNAYPYQQSSDLVDYDFNDLEGIWYATILRNKLIPTVSGYETNGLLIGEKMRNTAMLIMAEFSPTTTPLALKLINIGFIQSKGHNS